MDPKSPTEAALERFNARTPGLAHGRTLIVTPAGTGPLCSTCTGLGYTVRAHRVPFTEAEDGTAVYTTYRTKLFCFPCRGRGFLVEDTDGPPATPPPVTAEPTIDAEFTREED